MKHYNPDKVSVSVNGIELTGASGLLLFVDPFKQAKKEGRYLKINGVIEDTGEKRVIDLEFTSKEARDRAFAAATKKISALFSVKDTETGASFKMCIESVDFF